MWHIRGLLFEQDEALKEHTNRLGAAEHFSRQLARKHETIISERIERVCYTPVYGTQQPCFLCFFLVICLDGQLASPVVRKQCDVFQ